MKATPETLEVKTLRMELEAVHVDLQTDPARSREFQMLTDALARSNTVGPLLQGLAAYLHQGRQMGIPGTRRVAAASAFVDQIEAEAVICMIATGVQMGIDMQKARESK